MIKVTRSVKRASGSPKICGPPSATSGWLRASSRAARLASENRSSGAIPSGADVQAAYRELMAAAAAGEILVETEELPLSQVAQGWRRPGGGRRLVFVP
jgi:hypothetical protein